MKNKIHNGLKILTIIFALTFSFNICIASYNDVNTTTNELSTSTIEQIEYIFPERENGALQNELDELGKEKTGVLMNLINYKKPYFWILIMALALMVIILIRLFKKLSYMDREFESYRKKILNSQNDIKEADEIVYSVNDTNEIKPIAEEGEMQEIKVNNTEPEEIEEVEIKQENENLKISQDSKDEDYIFEE